MAKNVMIERRSLYEQGLNDRQIAEAQGVDRTSVREWRQRCGLPAQAAFLKNRKGTSPVRRFLYEMRWSDGAISRHECVHEEAVRDWRVRNDLPPNRSPSTPRKRKDQLKSLQHRVSRAVGTGLPVDIASDAAAELMMAVIEGVVSVSEIEDAARGFGNKALQTYADGFKFSSLDEPVPGSEDLLRVDLLRDQTSEDWLEEMGANWR